VIGVTGGSENLDNRGDVMRNCIRTLLHVIWAVACGKSTVVKICQGYGAAIVDADILGHRR
jgi:hypothetical protein